MLKDYIQKYYFEQNFNCAETIVRAANEYYDLKLNDRDMILVGGFGGGMQTGNTCGAILGAVSVLSMRYVERKAHESVDIKMAVTMLLSKFEEKYQAGLLCKDIKAKYFKEGVRCLETVEIACDVIEETIAEYENSKN